MSPAPEFPLQVFYDGSCSVCAIEVERYGRMDLRGVLILVDISRADFKPDLFEITREEFMHQMHAIDRNGTIFRGVDAFWAIWQAFPSSTLLGLCGKLLVLPLFNPLARIGYRVFASIRGYLPKRRFSCSGNSCRIDKE